MSLLLFYSVSCVKPRLAKVETGDITDITTTTASAAGNIIDLGDDGIIDYGHCWSTISNPTVDDFKSSLGSISRTGSYTSVLQNLQPGTKYYIKAYVKNTNGEVYYGSESSFSTISVAIPTLTTSPVTSVTSTTSISGGNITSDGGASITARGVCWSTSANPTIALSTKTSNGTGTGTFTSNITGLSGNMTYHVMAYATNSAGTSYGSDVTFTTPVTIVPPTVTTGTTTATSSITATSGGNVTSDGGATVTARGVCWSTSANPTIVLSTKTSNGTGAGSFTSNITGLTANTTYYVRAYATNSAGTTYGNQVSITTDFEDCTPALISPANYETLDNGCTDQNDGHSWFFDWSECLGATLYHLYVMHPTATIPAINIEITDSEYLDYSNYGYIGDVNRLGWTWKVRAYINGEWGEWSTERIFNVEPVNTDCQIADADGNVYNTVAIGFQIWLKENLKTTKYNDGTDIPLVINNTTWGSRTTPAYCWFNNDETTYKNDYGALYNWYAVITGKLCPAGWHVPSDNEWTTLTNYLGGESIAGGKLKETGTTHWDPNNGATNEYGFTALPGGLRYYEGIFDDIGLYGYWWSSTGLDVTSAWHREIDGSRSNLFRYNSPKYFGFSVRCLKD